MLTSIGRIDIAVRYDTKWIAEDELEPSSRTCVTNLDVWAFGCRRCLEMVSLGNAATCLGRRTYRSAEGVLALYV